MRPRELNSVIVDMLHELAHHGSATENIVGSNIDDWDFAQTHSQEWERFYPNLITP
jgi:hypothetical protein